MHREIENLKGSIGTMVELSKIVDIEVVNAINEVKKVIQTMTIGNENLGNGTIKAPIASFRRCEDESSKTRGISITKQKPYSRIFQV